MDYIVLRLLYLHNGKASFVDYVVTTMVIQQMTIRAQLVLHLMTQMILATVGLLVIQLVVTLPLFDHLAMVTFVQQE